MNVDHWHWQQWALAIILVSYLVVNLGFHGKPKKSKWNAGGGLIDFALMAWILTSSGFFA